MKRFFIILSTILFLMVVILSLVLYISFSKKKQEVTVTGQGIVEKIENIARLNVLRLKIKDVIEYEIREENIASLFTGFVSLEGRANVPLIVSGEVEYGFDLSAVKAEDIQIAADIITVSLPAPRITNYKINHQETRIWKDVEVNLAGKMQGIKAKQVIEEAYRQAELRIRFLASDVYYRNLAKQNAVMILKPILENFSGRKIEIVFKQ